MLLVPGTNLVLRALRSVISSAKDEKRYSYDTYEYARVFQCIHPHIPTQRGHKNKNKNGEGVRVTRGDAADAERLYRLYRRLGTE